jgi:hypothetical protein
MDAPDRADLQPSTSYRVAWRARILSQKALPNVAPISTTRATVRGLLLVSPPIAGARGLETLANRTARENLALIYKSLRAVKTLGALPSEEELLEDTIQLFDQALNDALR